MTRFSFLYFLTFTIGYLGFPRVNYTQDYIVNASQYALASCFEYEDIYWVGVNKSGSPEAKKLSKSGEILLEYQIDIKFTEVGSLELELIHDSVFAVFFSNGQEFHVFLGDETNADKIKVAGVKGGLGKTMLKMATRSKEEKAKMKAAKELPLKLDMIVRENANFLLDELSLKKLGKSGEGLGNYDLGLPRKNSINNFYWVDKYSDNPILVLETNHNDNWSTYLYRINLNDISLTTKIRVVGENENSVLLSKVIAANNGEHVLVGQLYDNSKNAGMFYQTVTFKNSDLKVYSLGFLGKERFKSGKLKGHIYKIMASTEVDDGVGILVGIYTSHKNYYTGAYGGSSVDMATTLEDLVIVTIKDKMISEELFLELDKSYRKALSINYELSEKDFVTDFEYLGKLGLKYYEIGGIGLQMEPLLRIPCSQDLTELFIMKQDKSGIQKSVVSLIKYSIFTGSAVELETTKDVNLGSPTPREIYSIVSESESFYLIKTLNNSILKVLK